MGTDSFIVYIKTDDICKDLIDDGSEEIRTKST